ncbi:MAG: serine hydrolase domain-containing protein [Gemmataceae bacterium]
MACAGRRRRDGARRSRRHPARLRGSRAGGKELVTPDTLFALSSCSKAFTTAAMAMLADEGKLTWDDPVRKHLRVVSPGRSAGGARRAAATSFATAPAWVSMSCCGIASVVAGRGSPPRATPLADAPFRTRLQYQSTMFTAAALAAASAAGVEWPDLVRKRPLVPLGMRHTRIGTGEADAQTKSPDRTASTAAGDPGIVPAYAPPHPDPAVGIHSTARDLAAWLRFHLNGGMVGDRRLVARPALGGDAHSANRHAPVDDPERLLSRHGAAQLRDGVGSP